MRKMPTIFERDNIGNRVLDAWRPSCTWVRDGEGIATVKLDGTCVLVEDGQLYRRRTLRTHEFIDGNLPEKWVPCGEADLEAGQWPGWLPASAVDPQDRHAVEALRGLITMHAQQGQQVANGTYELCGPKINGNPEKLTHNVLIKHGTFVLPDAPRTFDALKAYLADGLIEGIVWAHEDGRMAKIKGKDFGIRRKTSMFAPGALEAALQDTEAQPDDAGSPPLVPA